ncbi:nicotinamidase-related amidase [Ureibacillus xyleni]|uniref:Nicotinamidase-related amidase n=1 Tax=Ureibacillus xyleni TaxID=614648 RepID=A0A285TUP1_9BACL|nr:isochorismatase family protein [Ureibacillus xyleni]SOC25301.1 nicotinamidase-related amidase [Ureibacillus xyleni]
MIEKKSALLVIDMQLGPIWNTYKQEEVFKVVQKMIAKAEADGVHIFYIQFEDLDMLKKGTPFWQFAPGIAPREQDVIIQKQAADSFYQTKLHEELQKQCITDLSIVGVRTEYCIDTTCRSALSLGYQVTLIEDGHTTVDDVLRAEQIIKHHNVNLSKLSTPDAKIRVIPLSEHIY